MSQYQKLKTIKRFNIKINKKQHLNLLICTIYKLKKGYIRIKKSICLFYLIAIEEYFDKFSNLKGIIKL